MDLPLCPYLEMHRVGMKVVSTLSNKLGFFSDF